MFTVVAGDGGTDGPNTPHYRETNHGTALRQETCGTDPSTDMLMKM